MIKNIFRLIVIWGSLGIAGYSYANSNNGINMDALDKKQDWCVGRYSFQIPKNPTILGVTDKFDSFVIESTNGKYSDFIESIEETRNYYSRGRRSILKETETPKESQQKLTKIIWGDLDKTTDKGMINIVAYILDQNTLFTIKGGYSDTFKAQSDESINNIIKNLIARKNNIIPKENGICIANGFIRDSGEQYRFSRQIISFNYQNYPSLRLAFTVEAPYSENPNIVNSVTSNLEKQGVLQQFLTSMRSIRKGEKNQTTATNLKGIELVVESPMQGKSGIDANWEHTGTVKNANDPTIIFTLDSAYNESITKTSSLHEKEALRLYDQIIDSIKKFGIKERDY
jgi:hypothetical protein